MKPTLEQQSPTADEVARAIEWAKREMADRDYCAERRASSPELVAACGRDKRHLEVLVTAAKGADAKDLRHGVPAEVWVVIDKEGADFVAAHRQGAMDHASEAAGMNPEFGPFMVQRYLAAKESP